MGAKISFERYKMTMQSSFTKTFEKGSFIYKRGDPVEHFYVITRGQCEVMVPGVQGGRSQAAPPLPEVDPEVEAAGGGSGADPSRAASAATSSAWDIGSGADTATGAKGEWRPSQMHPPPLSAFRCISHDLIRSHTTSERPPNDLQRPSTTSNDLS